MKLFVSSLAPLWIYAALFVRAHKKTLVGKLLLFFYKRCFVKICGQRSSIMCHVVAFILREKCGNKRVKSRCVFHLLRQHFLSRFTTFLLDMVIERVETSECVHIREMHLNSIFVDCEN